MTGSGGLIGSALVRSLQEAGHRVRKLVRRPPQGPDELRWDPQAGTIDRAGLAGVEAVVNLAGEGVAEKRWTAEQKQRIRESRTQGTTTLATALAELDPKPSVLLNASAVGFYGDRGDEVLTEASAGGTGFLADVVRDWEAATRPAVGAGIRSTMFRTGIVLASDGGALKLQLPLFRLGLGGRLGPGTQWMPWISLEDEVGAIVHLLTADVEGPVNLSAPEPVTNAEFTRVLGRVLGRPAVLPVPRFAPKLLLGGQLVEEVVLSSARMLPERLLASGYGFRHRDLESALRAVLDKPAAA
ncbi:TIGR01777 family oxidoreductase [soil metagenome]